MHTRTAMAALSGTLVLSALAIPAAQADNETDAPARLPFATNTTAGDTQITKVVVNGGSDIVLGTTNDKTVTVTVTASDNSGIYAADAFLWHGTDLDAANGVDGMVTPAEYDPDCTAVNATTSTCKITMVMDPYYDLRSNTLAGTWKAAVMAGGWDEDQIVNEAAATVKVKRYAKLTVNASPEPVTKGKTITVTGNLTRANWETRKYAGYTSQSVKLQFRKKGSSTYTTVKTVTSGTGGTLKTTVTASTDGYWRWSFAGTSTTGTATSTADYVDVQ